MPRYAETEKLELHSGVPECLWVEKSEEREKHERNPCDCLGGTIVSVRRFGMASPSFEAIASIDAMIDGSEREADGPPRHAVPC